MDGKRGSYLARNVRAAKHLATKTTPICLNSPRKLQHITKMSAERTWMLLGESWMRCLQSAHRITRQIFQPVISWMCVFLRKKNNNLMGLRQVNDCGCGATGSRLNPNFYEVSPGDRRIAVCSAENCADTASKLPSPRALLQRERLCGFSPLQKWAICTLRLHLHVKWILWKFPLSSWSG